MQLSVICPQSLQEPDPIQILNASVSADEREQVSIRITGSLLTILNIRTHLPMIGYGTCTKYYGNFNWVIKIIVPFSTVQP